MKGGDLGKGFLSVAVEHSAAGHHLMLPAGQQPEHINCLLAAVGLAQHLALAHHNGVGGDDRVAFFPADGRSLAPADPGNLVFGRFVRVHGFVNVCGVYRKGDAEQTQQLPPPG